MKEELVKSKDQQHSFYAFAYADLSETLGPELQEIFPEFVFVPYICYINNGTIERYEGKMELKEIFEWMAYKPTGGNFLFRNSRFLV